jgi:hypothetical protein
MPVFFVRDCVRCNTKKVQHIVCGQNNVSNGGFDWEVAGSCSNCCRSSLYNYRMRSTGTHPTHVDGNIESRGSLDDSAVRIAAVSVILPNEIPDRIAGLFREANECRQMTWYEASGAMFRKTLDVATKHIYSHDARLEGKQPAQALRVRIKSLGEMGVLDQDIVELADVAALDGNDATHDVDPYTKEEAEALEDLTLDLLDRLFVRPAKIAAVKAKQIAAGVRPA